MLIIFKPVMKKLAQQTLILFQMNVVVKAKPMIAMLND